MTELPRGNYSPVGLRLLEAFIGRQLSDYEFSQYRRSHYWHLIEVLPLSLLKGSPFND